MKSHLATTGRLAVIGLLYSSFALGPATSAEASDFLVTLRGLNEVPPNSTSRLGVGGVTLNGNLLWYYLEADLSPQGGGIFGPAPGGANGPLILQFTNYGFLLPSPDAGGQVVYGGYLRLSDSFFSHVILAQLS